MQLSVVTTLYKSEGFINEFHRRICASANLITQDYEIIYVDDGSPDDSLNIAIDIQKKDFRTRVIELSKNFGHHPAIWTGLSHAKGDLVFLIDSDLEEAPELLGEFYSEFKKNNHDVVYGVAKERTGSWVKRIGGYLFYKGFNILADTPIPENLLTVRLMSRNYLEALLKHTESTFALSGLWARTGFDQVPLVVNKGFRQITSYNLIKRISMLVHTLTGFSGKPLVIGFYLGIFIFLISVVGALKIIFDRVFYSSPPEGWASIVVSLWAMGGLILFCQGIQGIYLSKIFLEAKRRPVSIIKKIHETRENHADKIQPAA
jgi:putative glycosyltransferase